MVCEWAVRWETLGTRLASPSFSALIVKNRFHSQERMQQNFVKKQFQCHFQFNNVFLHNNNISLFFQLKTLHTEVRHMNPNMSWWPCKTLSVDPRGVLPEKLSGGVRPASQNPYLFYDQNLRYSLPYLWPDQKLETQFMTRPSHQNPVSDLHFN